MLAIARQQSAGQRPMPKGMVLPTLTSRGLAPSEWLVVLLLVLVVYFFHLFETEPSHKKQFYGPLNLSLR